MSYVKAVQVSKLVCGRNHSAMLMNSGSVYTWGAASFGRLGLADAKKKQGWPSEVKYFENRPVRLLASGDFHMLAVGAKDNAVYSWGYGAEGQGGHGSTLHDRLPKKIEFFNDKKLASITCGPTWSSAVTESGSLYSWGYNDGGWTGITPRVGMPHVEPDHAAINTGNYAHTQSFDSRHNILIPSLVRGLSKVHVERVRCGEAHSVLFCVEKEGAESKGSFERDEVTKGEQQSVREPGPSPGGMDVEGNEANNESKEDSGVQGGPDKANSTTSDQQLLAWARHKKVAELSHAAQSGTDLNVQDPHGNTPLIVACQQGHLNVCKILERFGADLSKKNFKGNTALHYSMAYKFTDIANFLLENGADEFAINNEGLTCYEGLSSGDLENI
jgi:hypothetical protein